MRRSLKSAALPRPYSTAANLVQIRNGTFYKEHPASVATSNKLNPPLFPNLSFEIPATAERDAGKATRKNPHWAVVGTSPTIFLNVLKGEYLCIPPNARTFPYLASDEVARKDPRLRVPSRAIQYVGFQAGGGSLNSGVTGAYLSARYESRREETDWTVLQYLKGDTELNPSVELSERVTDTALLDRVVRDLRLQKLLDMPVSNLSNGQTRRSRIAKALLNKPELLLLDEPFMGLDPPTLVSLSPILRELAYKSSPLLVLGLRPQDPIPDWITHLAILAANDTVALMGTKAQVLFSLHHWIQQYQHDQEDQQSMPTLQQKLISLLNATYGKPLTNVGDSLTARGVIPYTAYKNARQIQPNMWSADGKILPDLLGDHSRAAWLQADQKPEKDRSIQDYLTLTSSIPGHLENTLTEPSIEVNGTTGAPSSIPGTTQPTKTDLQRGSEDDREPLIELNSIVIKYGPKTVLGFPPAQPGYAEPGLNLTIRRGTRLALLGPNGSGKTTLLSLLTSDHPQSYSLPIKFFGRTRLPAPGRPGLSLWEIQTRIGHSSPEVHAFFPKGLTVRQVLESAWAETWSNKPVLNAERDALVDHILRYFAPELRHGPAAADLDDLSWARDKVARPAFGRLDFGTQRLLLLLRAIIKKPDIIILDEAFSGLSNATRDKALAFMQQGTPDSAGSSVVDGVKFEGLTENQALVVVSHVREEVPGCVREWVRLPSEEEALELGVAVRMGTIAAGDVRSVQGWNAVWGL